MRTVEKRTTLRAEWTSDDDTSERPMSFNLFTRTIKVQKERSHLFSSQACTSKLLTWEKQRLLSVFGSSNKRRKKVVNHGRPETILWGDQG